MWGSIWPPQLTMRPILELGDLVPEHRPIRIGRNKDEFIGAEGTKEYKTEIVTLQAFVYGPRCPVLVKAALAQVAKKARQQVEENQGIMSDEIFQEYCRDCFVHLIPGITFEEADILSSDMKKATEVLKYLEYWKEDQQEVVEDGEGEAKREDQPTMQESSQTLTPSTVDSK